MKIERNLRGRITQAGQDFLLEHLEQLDADVDLPEPAPNQKDPLTHVTEQFIAATANRAGQLDWDVVEALVKRSDGIPEAVGTRIKNAATSAAFE